MSNSFLISDLFCLYMESKEKIRYYKNYVFLKSLEISLISLEIYKMKYLNLFFVFYVKILNVKYNFFY